MVLADFVIISVILLIGAILSITVVWIITEIPYIPTSKLVALAMVNVASLHGSECVYDLGAGTGTILRYAKRLHPGIAAMGIELSPVFWLVGCIHNAYARNGVKMRLGNILHADIRDADVIFLYMLPKMMERLEKHFSQHLRPGTIIVSHAFPLSSRKPIQEVKVPVGKKQATVFRYVW